MTFMLLHTKLEKRLVTEWVSALVRLQMSPMTDEGLNHGHTYPGLPCHSSLPGHI